MISLFKQKSKKINDDNIIAYIKPLLGKKEGRSFIRKLYQLFILERNFCYRKYMYQKISPNNIDRSIDVIITKNKNAKIYLLSDCDYTPNNVIKINFEDINKIEKDENTYFLVGYNLDFDSLNAVKALSKLNLKYHAISQALPMTRFSSIDKNAHETLIDEKKIGTQSYFCPIDFENIFQAIKITKDLVGDYVEIGTFQGASARAALNYMRRSGIKRKSYFFDTYEGFTYEEATTSEDAVWENTHTNTSQKMVQNYLKDYENAVVVKSNICQDELPNEIKNIALANIDVDLYDAIKSALFKVAPLVCTNGIIILEDFGHAPALIGAQKAVEEFLNETEFGFIPILLGGSSQMFLIKKENK